MFGNVWLAGVTNADPRILGNLGSRLTNIGKEDLGRIPVTTIPNTHGMVCLSTFSIRINQMWVNIRTKH